MEEREDVHAGVGRGSPVVILLFVIVLFVMVLSACASSKAAHPVHAGSGSTAAMPTMIPYRSPAKARVPGSVSSHSSPPASVAASRAKCPGTMNGFAISLPSGVVGAPTPIKAAESFAAHGSVTGFRVPPNAVWRVVGTDSHGDSVAAPTTGITLHAVQSPDKSWAIDSGERCA